MLPSTNTETHVLISICTPKNAYPRFHDAILSTKYFDDESELAYFGYRYYSPELGRFVSRDPFVEKGGPNIFAFVQNDPANYTDHLGKFRLWPPRRRRRVPVTPRAEVVGGDRGCCKKRELESIVNQWRNQINQIPYECLARIGCGPCTRSSQFGEYTPPVYSDILRRFTANGYITICSAVQDVEASLRHELQHAKQCDNQGNCGGMQLAPYTECQKQLCNEIQAYICGDAGTGEDCDNPDTLPKKEKCIKRALVSLIGHPAQSGDGPCEDCKQMLDSSNDWLPYSLYWPDAACFTPNCAIQ